VEGIFEKHVNWVQLIQNDDNYKNILQVRLQKAFKVTPIYREISPVDEDEGYHMGVYLCLGQDPHGLTHLDSDPYATYGSFPAIHDAVASGGYVYVFLGEGKHKIKKKAEQTACRLALEGMRG